MTTPPLRERVGALLVSLRGETSKAAAARRLGVARQTLMGMERGSWAMSLDKLDEVADAYGVTFELVARRDGQIIAADALDTAAAEG